MHLLRAHLPFAWAWPAYLIVSILAIIMAAFEWAPSRVQAVPNGRLETACC
jgi:hypothetical protein